MYDDNSSSNSNNAIKNNHNHNMFLAPIVRLANPSSTQRCRDGPTRLIGKSRHPNSKPSFDTWANVYLLLWFA